MTWDIFLGIVAIVGFAVTIGGVIWKLSKTLGILENTIQILNITISEFKKNSHETHERLFTRLSDDEKKLENHEIRILGLENERRKHYEN